MCTPAHTASSLHIFTQMQHFIVGFKCTCITQGTSILLAREGAMKNSVLNWVFSFNSQVACLSKKLAMASQLAISYLCTQLKVSTYLIFQGIAHTWLQWTMFCTEVPAEVWAIYTLIRFWKRIFSDHSLLPFYADVHQKICYSSVMYQLNQQKLEWHDWTLSQIFFTCGSMSDKE